ncbi:MAG: LamG-like jellyroll fold domain-containing protein [Nanoarchaeota archaeon]|nr:LamG-like jellyroll fold domain-containing protein [Nanoarchaeota archaeon]
MVLANFSALAVPPTFTSLRLNTTNLALNDTNQNLTAYVTPNAGYIKPIYNWFRNSQSIAVLNMPFEKINGTTSNNTWDYSGHGNPGTENNGVSWNSAGFDGNGTYYFDGLNDYISIADSNIFDTGDKITVSAWIKTNYSNQTGKGIVMHDNSNYKWMLYFSGGSTSDVVQFYIRTTTGASTATCTYANGVIANNNWHLLTGTYVQSSTSERIKVYYDGSFCGNATGYNELILDGDEGIYIGRWGSNYFNGSIDDILVFNRTLSPEQINALYKKKFNLIALNETITGENWKVHATPNANGTDGITNISNTVTILNNSANCGLLTSDTILDLDVSSTGNCFTIGANNISLDCAGHNITYSTSGTLGYGINNSGGYDNVMIKNCEISEGNNATNNKHAIYSLNGINMTLKNNTITTIGSSTGIYLVSSSNSSVFENTITTSGINAEAIALSPSAHSEIYDNSLRTSGTSSKGIFLSQSHNSSIYRNTIVTSGSSSYGLWISLNSNSTFFSNNITTSGSGSYGITLEASSGDNLFLNNSISASQDSEIFDATSNSYINKLVYNNSFGEIRWMDTANDGFLKNLTFNGQIGFGNNLFIGNNTIALNTTAFSNGKINSSANIMFKGLAFSTINILRRVDNFTTNVDDIYNAGYNCSSSGGIPCRTQSYSSGILQFNTTGFSSFTTNYSNVVEVDVTSPIVSLLFPTNRSTWNKIDYYNLNFSTNEISNITLNDSRWTLLAVRNGVSFNFSNNTALADGSYDIKVYVNDSAANNGSININFIKDTTAPVVTLLSPVNRSTILFTNYYNLNITSNEISNITLNDTRWTLISAREGRFFNFSNNTPLANGNYDIKVYANDSTGNNGSININFVKSGCAELTSSLTLTEDISFPGTCFTVATSHITLDCNGFNITYATNNSDDQFGISINSSSNNITVRDCEITRGSTSGSSQHAMRVASSSSHRFINNTINVRAGGVTSVLGMSFTSSQNNTIENNTVHASSSSGHGIQLSGGDSHGNMIRYNNITTTGTSGHGIFVTGGNNDNNYIEGNKIGTVDGNAINLADANQTYLINNNLSSTRAFEILDSTPVGDLNFLIYNDSFIDLRWHNNGSGNFYENLTINSSRGLGLGLGLFFANNTFAFNITEFQFPARQSRINSSANITFKGLSFSTINELRRTDNFTTDSEVIRGIGYNCTSAGGVLCTIRSYSGGILQFNTTGFSSFTANETTTSNLGINVYNLSLINTNSSFYSAFRFFIRNVYSSSQLIDWGFDTNETNIVSNSQPNLTVNENIFVFVEHNYTISGTHTIIANSSSTASFDSEQQQVTIG